MLQSAYGEPNSSETAIEEAPIDQFDREHWSFLPLQRPAVPAVKDTRWPQTPIDRFVLAGLEADGLQPLPPAGRRVLIRRLCFDLIGLPPSPAEVERFVQDRRPDAYVRLVDRLLDDPAYGERWAQHWLDLARFAETDGFEHDLERKTAWRYRDWVIAALNEDLPYDRFVQRQLAGDEMQPADATATHFCLAGPDMPDINRQPLRRDHLLNDMTATVGAVFMALQMGCAQCHDHKYDPISQADFYRLRAIFEPAVHVRSRQSVTTLKEPGGTPEPSYLRIRGTWDRIGPEVRPAVPRIADLWDTRVPESAEELPTSGRRLALARWLTRPDHPLTSRVIVNRVWQHHFGRGLSTTPSDFGVMGHPPTHPRLLDWLATELVRRDWSLKQMHRLIVTSATYRTASRPADPSWNERQRTAARRRWQRLTEQDPQNELCGRANRRRLEGEIIRDAMLAASGQLTFVAGGPGVRPPLSAELRQTLLKNQWKVDQDPAQHQRRSIYVFARRNLRFPIFDVFDRPDANATCPRRNQSTIAPQSLLMLNSAESLAAARLLAGRVLRNSADSPEDQVTALYQFALCREPAAEESQQCSAFLRQQAGRLRDEQRSIQSLALPEPTPSESDPYASAALTDLALAVLNLSEFVYVD